MTAEKRSPGVSGGGAAAPAACFAVSSAALANAIPVVAHTLAAILLAGKDAFASRDRLRAQRAFPGREFVPGIGNHGRGVGVVGASRIGRRLLDLPRPFDLRVGLVDPHVDETGAAALGVPLPASDDLLRGSDIVTPHAPERARPGI